MASKQGAFRADLQTQIPHLEPCPHCGAPARLIDEGWTYYKRFGHKVHCARIVCVNNNPHRYGESGFIRCLCKTVAAPIGEVVASWNKRYYK